MLNDTKLERIKRLSSQNSQRFGQCYLVKETGTENLFVQKIVPKSNLVGYEQLKNESNFSFNTLGLPKIVAIQETDFEFGFVRKYTHGITLTEFWKTVKRKEKSKTIAKIVLSLAPLFAKLEEENIVHCDIKPENILVNEINGELHCTLIDFGLAFRRENLPRRKTLFQLAYSPPELVLNRLNCVDFSSDVFSFCLIIYKLLNGKLPFSSENPALLTQLQITYPIEKTWKIKNKYWKILEKGLQKHRFQKSPNYYTIQETDQFLLATNKKRYFNFAEMTMEFQKLFPEI